MKAHGHTRKHMSANLGSGPERDGDIGARKEKKRKKEKGEETYSRRPLGPLLEVYPAVYTTREVSHRAPSAAAGTGKRRPATTRVARKGVRFSVKLAWARWAVVGGTTRFLSVVFFFFFCSFPFLSTKKKKKKEAFRRSDIFVYEAVTS